MTIKDWETIKHFTPEENWGDPLKMSLTLLHKMDELRAYVDSPIIIHGGYSTDGHSPQSYHYKGMAVDFHIKGLSLLEQYLAANETGFTGIGTYPFWNSPGLHCDVRELHGECKTTWYQDKKGKYHYPLMTKFL